MRNRHLRRPVLISAKLVAHVHQSQYCFFICMNQSLTKQFEFKFHWRQLWSAVIGCAVVHGNTYVIAYSLLIGKYSF
jgi:hypothetical protein